MHKITNLWKFELNWSSKLRENDGRKNTLVTQVECFEMLKFETSAEVSNSVQIFEWEIASFSLQNYVTSEEAVSHKVKFFLKK